MREAIAVHLRASRGVECDAEQVVITGGSQQAIRQLAHLLLDPGDRVWMEDPGYIRAHQALTAVGARRVGAWILEDDYDSEYRFRGRPLQALQGLDRGGSVVYMGTFSKILFPALRPGYLVLPRVLLEPWGAGVAVNDGAPPTLPQAVATEFIREGHFARHIRRMRSLCAERREVLVEALRSELGDTIEIGQAEAGMHLHVRLPPGLDDHRAYERAAAGGVIAFPLSRYCARRPEEEGGYWVMELSAGARFGGRSGS